MSYYMETTCPHCNISGHTTGECDDEGNKDITYGNCKHCGGHYGWDDDLKCAVDYETSRRLWCAKKISSYKVVFYDMHDEEVIIPDRVLKQAYSEIDQAIYEWEQGEI